MFSNVVNTHCDTSPQKSVESIDDNVTNINNIKDNNQYLFFACQNKIPAKKKRRKEGAAGWPQARPQAQG
jgi:hypothetical protein